MRFAPIVQRTGIYDVRGTVIDPSTINEFTWTPYNFEGFYYDIDDDVGTESLKAIISGGSRIDEKNLIYTTSPQPVKFKFTDWGKYDVIGFMADKYFAGYNNQTAFTDEASVINEGQLRRRSCWIATTARRLPADRLYLCKKAMSCASSRWI